MVDYLANVYQQIEEWLGAEELEVAKTFVETVRENDWNYRIPDNVLSDILVIAFPKPIPKSTGYWGRNGDYFGDFDTYMDRYLGNPFASVNFFKTTYRRHTNFVIENDLSFSYHEDCVGKNISKTKKKILREEKKIMNDKYGKYGRYGKYGKYGKGGKHGKYGGKL